MFITFEGPDGSGKTKQIKKTFNYLKKMGINCILTREPGSGPVGIAIRKLLLSSNTKGLVQKAEYLLFMADRAQHFGTVVLPSLDKGKVVLCDRCLDSSVVYQGIVGGLGVDYVRGLHNFTFDNFKPEITFLLDVSPEVGLTRSTRRLEEDSIDESRFEDKGLEFQRKVRAGFLQIAQSEPERFQVVNAEPSPQEVWQEIKKILDKFFKF